MSSRSNRLASKPGLAQIIEVKSKFDAEFRRFSLVRGTVITEKFDDFFSHVERIHRIESIPFVICYTDPIHGDLLPINNDDNFVKALTTAKPLLRLNVQRKGQWETMGYGTLGTRKKNPLTKLISGAGSAGATQADTRPRPGVIPIGLPEHFRRVSAIIDVDVVPETHRRVKLMKNGTDRPLGFYIRDGTSVRVTGHGLEKVPGIFVSRLVPGGLAESTGLLAVNDEVLEVNGIEVAGRTLDQVTDMMVANSANLIVTVKPVNQRNNVSPRYRPGGGGTGGARGSQKSTDSLRSAASVDSDEVRTHLATSSAHLVEEDEDDVRDHIPATIPSVSDQTQEELGEAEQPTLQADNQCKVDSGPVWDETAPRLPEKHANNIPSNTVTNSDGVPSNNIVTNIDGVSSNNIVTNSEGLPSNNIVTNSDGVPSNGSAVNVNNTAETLSEFSLKSDGSFKSLPRPKDAVVSL